MYHKQTFLLITGGGGGWSRGLGSARGRYLVQLIELDPLLLRAAASDRRHVQHPVTKLHEGAPERRHRVT